MFGPVKPERAERRVDEEGVPEGVFGRAEHRPPLVARGDVNRSRNMFALGI